MPLKTHAVENLAPASPGAPQWLVSWFFEPRSTTNRVSQIGSLTASYDLAGNMTGDGTHTYQWDAEDRMVSIDSGSTATLKYNSLGQRVERFLPTGSWTFDYLFGLNGEELGLYSAGTAAWFDQHVSMGGRVLVMYGSPLRMLHVNNLGTTTVTTDQTGAELQDELFYPWGQDWTRAGQPYVMHFAGMQGFEDPGLVYPTDFRRYNPALGRRMTPDPAGMAASDPSNPQSWNRYAYVMNNPVSYVDPSGLFRAAPPDDVNSVDLTSLGDVGVLTPEASEHGVPGSDSRTTIAPAPPSKPKQPPYLCSADAVFLRSFDLTTKVGFEVETPVFKVGFDLFKNNTTGETGGEMSAGTVVFGGEVSRINPPGTPINSNAGSLHVTAHLLPAQHDFATGETRPVPLSHFVRAGFAFGVGGSVSFNSDRFKQLNAQCGNP